MSQQLRSLWVMAFGVTLALAPAVLAQDMTIGVVTDPPAPVADGYATFTGTYENLGPGPAADMNATYFFSIQQDTWPPDSAGFNAMMESAVGTDTNGNEVLWSFESTRMCQHYQLVVGTGEGDQYMIPNPMPAAGGGSFTWQLPVIPMEGVGGGRLVITEPEQLRNSYGLVMDAYNPPFQNVAYQYMGTFNLVYQPPGCDDLVGECADLAACAGPRLWTIDPPIEADLVLADDGFSSGPYACGELVNADQVAGKIALIQRGGSTASGGLCYLNDKILSAQNANAIGAILVNGYTSTGVICGDFGGDPEECEGPFWGVGSGEGYLYTIPFVMMSKRQGEELIAAVQAAETVRAMMGNIPDDVVDVYTWMWSPDDDPDLTNDIYITRVPLGPMGPTEFVSAFPAAAYAAGAQGAFFQTDIDINNKDTEDASFTLAWLPRGADNSVPVESAPIVLAPGQSVQYENVLNSVFSLEPDVVGAIAMIADSPDVIGMSRTYNVGGAIGNFGQGLPAIRTDQLIGYGETRRIIFMSENDAIRANVGCINGLDTPAHINIGLFGSDGTLLETKTMDLPPWSNKQLNRVFQAYAPVNGYVEVATTTEGGAFYCYGSALDNLTSDPTTVLPQVPSGDFIFVPAAALAAGAQGAFFQTDLDLVNVGATMATFQFAWLPRGEDNSLYTLTSPYGLEAGASVRYDNALYGLFLLEPDAVGALAIDSESPDLLVMSRTYNLLGEGNPLGFPAGATFGQELPGIPADMMIATGEKKRIIFMNENDEVRSNVGCQNGVGTAVNVTIEMHDAAGALLETKYMALPPWSNNQINRIFRNYAPVNGYVDIFTNTPDASIYCYGSVLDNINSDPTTVLPQ